MHRTLRISWCLALLALASVPASASAVMRFASSQSSDTSGTCETAASACKLSRALAVATSSDSVEVLSDGVYVLDTTASTSASAVFGEPGKPRPQIANPSTGGPFPVFVTGGQTWSHVDLRTVAQVSGVLTDAAVNLELASSATAVIVAGGVVRDTGVTVTTAAGGSGATAVSLAPAPFGAAPPQLTASTVRMSGTQAKGVAVPGTAGNGNASLRGATVIATGTDANALAATGMGTAIPGPPPEICFGGAAHVDVVDSILRGSGNDVSATYSGCVPPGTTLTSVRLRASNFRATKLTASGGATIDSSDSTNQTSLAQTDDAAIFVDAAADNYHQRAGAPTIDAGSGLDAPALDVDLEPRVAGTAADIGADESQVATVAGGIASDVTTTGATLSAAVGTAGGTSTIRFEYGPTSAYGAATAESALEADALQAPAVAVGGLAAATTYHFRAVVTTTSNGATRVVTGADRTFTTAAVPPPSGGGGGGGGGVTTPTPLAFVARNLKAPSSVSLKTLPKKGLKFTVQVGAIGSKVTAALFTGGVRTRARAAAAAKPVVSKTVSADGTVTLTVKIGKAAAKKLRRVKKLTLVVTVTPPAATGAKALTLTKSVKLKP